MGHIVYVRKRYYVKSEGTNDNDTYKAVYDCMNSEGIKDPYPIYSTEDENIKKIYKVIVNADPLEMEDWRPPKLQVIKRNCIKGALIIHCWKVRTQIS